MVVACGMAGRWCHSGKRHFHVHPARWRGASAVPGLLHPHFAHVAVDSSLVGMADPPFQSAKVFSGLGGDCEPGCGIRFGLLLFGNPVDGPVRDDGSALPDEWIHRIRQGAGDECGVVRTDQPRARCRWNGGGEMVSPQQV